MNWDLTDVIVKTPQAPKPVVSDTPKLFIDSPPQMNMVDFIRWCSQHVDLKENKTLSTIIENDVENRSDQGLKLPSM